MRTLSEDWTCNFVNTIKTMISQSTISDNFYHFVTISAPIDADFQSKHNGSIFIWNGWKLTTIFCKYSKWLKIHQIHLFPNMDLQPFWVFAEYCRQFPSVSDENRTVVFGLKICIDWCRNCHKMIEIVRYSTLWDHCFYCVHEITCSILTQSSQLYSH